MSNDRAPVCNLPNVGQVPALMPGRLYSAIPKAQDLPSLIQATNALAQIVNQLTQPGLAPFNNNLAPVSQQSPIAGTPGIVSGAGADGSGGHAGKDGKDGKEAQDPKYKETERKTERVKVKGTEDNAEAYLILRRVNHLTMTASADGQKKIVWQGQPGAIFASPQGENRVFTVLNAGEGRPFTGTDKFDRETVEENPAFPSQGVNASGTAEKPFEVGLMSDCVGVKWGVKGCRFAVCGYGGFFVEGEVPHPVFQGFGAYSEDGKSWTVVQELDGTANIFAMRDPRDKSSNLVVLGGSTNQEAGSSDASSTAELVTIAGSGPSASGGSGPGRNTFAFTAMGYHKQKGIMYAVEVDNEDAATLHTFQIGNSKPPPTTPPSKNADPPIFWAGSHYPGIDPVFDCTAPMHFRDSKGKRHDLTLPGDKLLFDGNDVNPPGATVTRAAGGVNDDGDIILIAIGFDTDTDFGKAWWSVEGNGWTEITLPWGSETALMAAQAAVAVPNF